MESVENTQSSNTTTRAVNVDLPTPTGRKKPNATPASSAWNRLVELLPGVMLALVAAGISYGVSRVSPVLSPMIVAILLGVLVANVVRLPNATTAGIDFSAKKLLRAGIILLGLKLVLSDIVALGAPMLLVVVCVVTFGILGTIILGRLLKVPSRLTLLIACGFSICGAAAVAGAAGIIDPNDEHEQDTVTAVALVVIFGTLMIPLLPFLAGMIGMDSATAGMWAGASVHEIAQVVAVGGILGSSALTVAVIVKLARVLLLAPVAAVLSVRQRRIYRGSRELAANDSAVDITGTSGAEPTQLSPQTKMPPLVPLFVLGFLAMVLLRSFVDLPADILAAGNFLQTALLAAAMFGLGCGVKIRNLITVGFRPFALAALATILVSVVAYVGIMLVG